MVFSITEPYRDNLKSRYLIKSGYNIVPYPSTALCTTKWRKEIKTHPYLVNLPTYIISTDGDFTPKQISMFFAVQDHLQTS